MRAAQPTPGGRRGSRVETGPRAVLTVIECWPVYPSIATGTRPCYDYAFVEGVGTAILRGMNRDLRETAD